MNFKKGDTIHNGCDCSESTQLVKLLSDLRRNNKRTGEDCGFRNDYPYVAKAIHIKGKYTGEIVEGYFISKDSILVKGSGEFFNRIVKPFEFA